MNPAPITAGQFANLSTGARIHYASCGSPKAPLLLFVHGFPQAWFEWEAQLAYFGEHFFAVAPDLRGFHLSSKPRAVEAYRSTHVVADLVAFIGALGAQTALVVAHDWGGAVAWNLAIFHAACVERLVILNAPHPYCFARDLQHDPEQIAASQYMNMLRAHDSESRLAANQYALLESFLCDASGQLPAWFDAATRARYHAMWSIPGEAASHGLTGGLNYYRASPLYPGMQTAPPALQDADSWRLSVPTRVIWGQQDRALRPGLLAGLDTLIDDLQISLVPDGSHWLIQEQPQAINGLIAQALAH